jgi:predicted transcriptional regulator
VEDILTPLTETFYLKTSDKVSRWHTLNLETTHSRYPVVDQNMKIQGMVTAKDIMGQESDTTIEKIMTKQPMTVSGKTSVASTAHMMVWEGIEVLPVVDDTNRLEGIISRQDVLKALQMNQRQPQVGETLDDIVTNQMVLMRGRAKGEEVYTCEVTPQMTNHLGTISYGVFTTVVSDAANRVLRSYKKGDLVVENMTIYFLKPVQMESILEIYPRVLEVGRKFGKVDVEVFNDGILVGKAMMMCQLIDRN